MFNFLDMLGNYDSRCVDRYEEEDKLIISTTMVTDGGKPYETAVSHPSYNSGKWVIVETYETEEQAQQGHDSWVQIMTSEQLPDSLKNTANAEIAQFGEAIGIEMEFPKEE